MRTLVSRLLSFAAYLVLFIVVPVLVTHVWAWTIGAERVELSSWTLPAGCLAAVFFWVRSIKLSSTKSVIDSICGTSPRLGLEISSARGLLLVSLAVAAVSMCLHAANLWLAVATDTPYIRPTLSTQLAFAMIGFVVVEYVSFLVEQIRFDYLDGATPNA